MITLNLISGLGADERVFSYLNTPCAEKNHVSWIDPVAGESIEGYAERLKGQIDLTKRNVLLCVSFGGLVGIELSKTVQFEKIIIISSVKSRHEIPFYYRIAGCLHIDKIIPSGMYKSCSSLLLYMFGITANGEKELFRTIIRDTNSKFLKWAIGEIIRWRCDCKVNNLYHIHGSLDRILPVCFIKDCVKIAGGHHFMIVSMGDAVSAEINEILSGHR